MEQLQHREGELDSFRVAAFRQGLHREAVEHLRVDLLPVAHQPALQPVNKGEHGGAIGDKEGLQPFPGGKGSCGDQSQDLVEGAAVPRFDAGVVHGDAVPGAVSKPQPGLLAIRREAPEGEARRQPFRPGSGPDLLIEGGNIRLCRRFLRGSIKMVHM